MSDSDLRKMFDRQREFNVQVFADRNLPLGELSMAERATWTKEFILHVTDELHEFLRETNWKMHRRGVDAPVSRGNLLEEYIDCLKFLIGLGNVWNFTAEEVIEEFERKSRVVEYKYAMEQRLRSLIYAKEGIVAVDIDGVLNWYPADFLRWITAVYGVPAETEAAARNELGPREYLRLKDVYRESGAKRHQVVRDGAKKMLDGLRACGLSVVLLSKRPFWRFSRIYADTLEWLSANGLAHDALLMHPEKHRKIVEDFPDLIAMIEDDPGVARDVADAGVRVILVDSAENEGIDVPDVERVQTPLDVLKLIDAPRRV